MKRLVIVAVCLIIGIGILATLLYPRKLIFYYTFPFWFVRNEYKEFAKKLYNENAELITQIRVADDSRSGWCTRWIFISDVKLAYEDECSILNALYGYMKERTTFRTPLVWEIFFVSEKTVYCAYVSRYGQDLIIGNGDDRFLDWESVPNIESVLPYDTLVKKMTGIGIITPMYLLDPRPIAEMSPNIPK